MLQHAFYVITVVCTNQGLVLISPDSIAATSEGSGTTAGVGLATTRAACEACTLLFGWCQTCSDGPVIGPAVPQQFMDFAVY